MEMIQNPVPVALKNLRCRMRLNTVVWIEADLGSKAVFELEYFPQLASWFLESGGVTRSGTPSTNSGIRLANSGGRMGARWRLGPS
jgi:hypothetical protein